jgi:hypothetical protein
MRLSIQKPLTGLLVAGVLALSAVGAEAMGGGGGNANGPDAYIGIIGGSPQQYNYSATGNINGGGYAGDENRGYPNDGGWGHYNGGYHTGY